MWPGPLAVKDCTKRHGYGFERGTLIGVQYRYGSSSSLRESRRALAHGSSGISPGFNPPSRSISSFEPPPTHGPEMSGVPSNSFGAGRDARSAGASGVNSPASPVVSLTGDGAAAGRGSCANADSVNPTSIARRIIFRTSVLRVFERRVARSRGVYRSPGGHLFA